MDQRTNQFPYHGTFTIEEGSLNGFVLNGVYVPEDILIRIFMMLPPGDLFRCSAICKRWCNIIKSDGLWQRLYNRSERPNKTKNLPWYVYYCYFSTSFFRNMLRNGNGQEEFRHWRLLETQIERFQIETVPVGCPPLPEDVPEFNGHQSCFATSHRTSRKCQKIELEKCPLLMYIIRKHKPSIIVSEWYCWRYEAACKYKVYVCIHSGTYMESKYPEAPPRITSHMTHKSLGLNASHYIKALTEPHWTKVQLESRDYPYNLVSLSFCHSGESYQTFPELFYGSKFAGCMMRFSLDSINPERPADFSSSSSFS